MSLLEEHSNTVICSWSERDTTVERIEAAAVRLRAEHAGTATRTSVVNLVAVAHQLRTLERTSSAMRELGARHPGRSISIHVLPDGSDRIDATVTLHRSVAEGHMLWWEDLSLSVRGRVAAHLDSVVAPLVLPGLPLVAWYPGVLPRLDDPLATTADAVITDIRFASRPSRSMGTPNVEAHDVAALLDLAARQRVLDLSWLRLRPWRQLLAALFDLPGQRGFGAGPTEAEVRANRGPALLLAGWLGSRLSLGPEQIRLGVAQHASIRLRCSAGDRQAEFSVWRSAEDAVTAESIVEGHTAAQLIQPLPLHGLTWSLASALSDLAPEPDYLAALRWAAEHLPEIP